MAVKWIKEESDAVLADCREEGNVVVVASCEERALRAVVAGVVAVVSAVENVRMTAPLAVGVGSGGVGGSAGLVVSPQAG